jgi:hypothetical protein
MDLRTGIESRSSGKKVQRPTFARFLGPFEFRLLQQYLPISAASRPSSCAGCRILEDCLGTCRSSRERIGTLIAGGGQLIQKSIRCLIDVSADWHFNRGMAWQID